jgi:hypothetical protein
MAGGGNDWNSFMQSRLARIVLNGVCAVMTASYAIDAVRELLSGGSPMMIEQIGTTGYYALTIARLLVCAWVSVVFTRATLKVMREQDDER